ncbi:hypothetical protein SSX86_004434 [Deinandra increscens subsp. villosa]|uniref:Thioredoxin superfamily protein n=1 Tax=Deinandra increscens subsp. villosa TaxID=3103831 RepID=A0AAP0DK28_9ASTR
MSSIKIPFLVLLLLILINWAVLVPSQPIIPSRYDGFVYRRRAASTATVLIEAFYDPVCPDSRDSWPPLKQAVDHYGPSRLSLIIHTFPLPYHDNAFVTSRALHIVNELNASATYHLLNAFFKHQERFYNAQTLNMSREGVLDLVIGFASSTLGNSMQSAIRSGFNDTKTGTKTRVSFKYGCSRGVYGTPFFFVNGFLIPVSDDTIDYDGWRKIIDPLIKEQRQYPSNHLESNSLRFCFKSLSDRSIHSMKLQTLSSSFVENLDPMLNESIYHFLAEFQKGRTDFSELSSIFFRLIQTMTEPPLEFIWFYSAITFQTSKSSSVSTDSQNYLVSVKDLFHSLISFRNPSGSSYLKQVSLIAPVLYHLVNFKSAISSLKTEIEGLADEIIRHIIMCSDNDLAEQEIVAGKSTVSWVGLVPVWIADQVGENRGCVDGFRLFFPLLTEDIRRGIHGDCGMNYLGAVVMIETFLFRLCLMFDSGASESDLHKDVKNYAAQIIHGFKRNSSFLVMLLKLLLEPSLPVGELLATPHELILRRLLYDVALDFSLFLHCDTFADVQYKEIVILWLFVANSAVQFASENGDHVGVDRYLNAFSASQLPRQIISWVTGVTSMKPTAPDVSSPKDIIGWLLVLEQHGLKVCDHNISELHEKALKYNSMGIDNGVKDGQTMVEDAPVKINGGRKRSNTGFWEAQKQIKVIKCCHENLGDDGFCGKTDVGNSVSDQEMVDMVR